MIEKYIKSGLVNFYWTKKNQGGSNDPQLLSGPNDPRWPYSTKAFALEFNNKNH
jgi:hypothetical protein